ncbi:MAG: 4Fe-4S binding protein [Deltaproteobacteria bacterium]|nr:4Fe-4S binding protein [Deltaproteobacteria bacterium]
MSEEIYNRLAKVLDTLPNGFPATESGIEIRLLKRIFRPEDAELFCELRLSFETTEQIAQRTNRPLEGLEDHLKEMARRGQIMMVDLGSAKLFRMMPWVFGIFEFQLPHLDRDLAEMSQEYNPAYAKQFFLNKPQLMQVVPIQRQIPVNQMTLPYEQVSSIIENGQAFLVNECICKKEQGLLDHPCSKPVEVCLAIAPIQGIFDKARTGRAITKAEAYEVLRRSEEAGMVHLTSNVESGHFYICNCCGCCCGVLRALKGLNYPQAVNSHFYAEIDPDKCALCGLCREERCQIDAIVEDENTYRVIKDRCIGCGLCATTCPSEAIRLVRKPLEEITSPPKDEMSWYEERARQRGVDFSAYK